MPTQKMSLEELLGSESLSSDMQIKDDVEIESKTLELEAIGREMHLDWLMKTQRELQKALKGDLFRRNKNPKKAAELADFGLGEANKIRENYLIQYFKQAMVKADSILLQQMFESRDGDHVKGKKDLRWDNFMGPTAESAMREGNHEAILELVQLGAGYLEKEGVLHENQKHRLDEFPDPSEEEKRIIDKTPEDELIGSPLEGTARAWRLRQLDIKMQRTIDLARFPNNNDAWNSSLHELLEMTEQMGKSRFWIVDLRKSNPLFLEGIRRINTYAATAKLLLEATQKGLSHEEAFAYLPLNSPLRDAKKMSEAAKNEKNDEDTATNGKEKGL